MIVYYLTFLDVLGCLPLSIALCDTPWVDFKAEYSEEVGITATDIVKKACHSFICWCCRCTGDLPAILTTTGRGLVSPQICAHWAQRISLRTTNPNLLAIILSEGVIKMHVVSTMACSCANSCAQCTVALTGVLRALSQSWEKCHQARADTWVHWCFASRFKEASLLWLRYLFSACFLSNCSQPQCAWLQCHAGSSARDKHAHTKPEALPPGEWMYSTCI